MNNDVASFFSGCGGLDLGFRKAGFNVLWANEFDTTIQPTYIHNHPGTNLCTLDIRDVNHNMIPQCSGFIGGPPCQAWSEGGAGLGLNDARGRVFLDYLRLISDCHPDFFIIENVPGILSEKHSESFNEFINILSNADYDGHYKLLDAKNFGVPQDRVRLFIVGFRKDLHIHYRFPVPNDSTVTLQDAIGDIWEQAPNRVIVDNNDVYYGPFDTKYMARNRVRGWKETSYTIQALAKNAPIHPQAPKMVYISENKRIFKPGYEKLYRRLSVRECARIQSFPDDFIFYYSDVRDGYKMVGNAVPPRLAYALALSIKEALNL